MTPNPKTIQIFLPGGDPLGIRIAELTTRIVQVIEVPRSLLQDFFKMPESNQVAVYFLVGQSADVVDPRVYIGQTGDPRARLASHSSTKEFWEKALVLISRTNSLTQTHATFLEWHCLQAVRKAGRYSGENGNVGSRPHTPAPLEADCLEIFETGRVLLSTLGYPVFDAVRPSAPESGDDELFYCTAGGVDGRGLYTSEGFVVLKGSRGKRENSAALDANKQRFRQVLFESGVLLNDGDQVVFQKDHLFGSPSTAAAAVLGRTSNGWKEWRTKAGVTLDDVKRTGVESER